MTEADPHTGQGADNTSGLRIREAVRALVLDPSDRVLLVRFEFPAGTRWALPGGGLDPGESHHDALRRELIEEVGLHDVTIGAHIWNRLHLVKFISGQFDGQREQIFQVRCPAFDPHPQLTWQQMNAEYVFELRWWSVDEIATSDARFVPAALHQLIGDLLTFGPPASPIDVET